MDSNLIALPDIACQICGQLFKPLCCELFGRRVLVARICQPCVEAHEAEHARREQAEQDALRKIQAMKRWRAICPELYDSTEPERLSPRGLEAVNAWQWGPRGLILVGHSGTGKTRTMYLLMRRLFEQGRKIKALTASEFRRATARAALAGTSDEFMDELSEVDVLFIDDLGQMKVTESASEALLDILDARAGSGRPCFFTTQYSGDELIRQFAEKPRGEAIVRRIREFCAGVRL